MLLSVPLKTVLTWHMDNVGETVPESYVVCDGRTLSSAQQDINPGGSYTVPDLRNKFILGADPTKAATSVGDYTVTGPAGAPGPRGSLGANNKTLAVADLPSHTHNFSMSTNGAHQHIGASTTPVGTHSHTATISTVGTHSHTGSTMAVSGSHTHAGSTTTSAGDHSHSINDPGHHHRLQARPSLSGPTAAGLYADENATYNTDNAYTNITIMNNGAHVHGFTLSADGNHTHSLSLSADGSHTHTITIDAASAPGGTVSIPSDGDHFHTLSGGSTGGGNSIDMRPSFYGLVMIMKVKK